MYKRVKIQSLDDYFTKLSARREQGVYFYRINDYTPQIHSFLVRYIEEARRTGVVISGKIANPDEHQLSYYEEIMGLSFFMQADFFKNSLSKWLPGMNAGRREDMALSMYHALEQMKQAGKNENILKNAYIKFMCWLYYKFTRIINQLGMDNLPKVIYEGQVSSYELKMLGILADTGCDILLVQKKGDANYLTLDPAQAESVAYQSNPKGNFSEDFNLASLEKELVKKAQMSRLFDESAVKVCSTNTWISGDILKDTLKAPQSRGDNPQFIYNLFCRMSGVNDKASYSGELFKWKNDLAQAGRSITVLEGLQVPSPDELAKVPRRDYRDFEALLADMVSHIKCKDHQLESQARKALTDLLTEEAKSCGGNLNRVKNRAIYLICWFNRYYREIFSSYKEGSISVFVLFGICRTRFESCFLRFLSRLPVDVIVLNPELERTCLLEDSVLYDKREDLSLKLEKFPVRAGDISYGTAAYHAEQDLTELMYQDTGLYREKQYQKAVAISLQTMYEEMYILWDQEAKYRPNFETLEDKVILPVMAGKISGVKDGDVNEYWSSVRKLLAEDTVVIHSVPYIAPNSIAGVQNAPLFLKNRKLLRDKIKSHPTYRYGIFREETQEHILDKIQELLDSGLIKGTYSQGMEFKIIAVALNLEKEITRLIQKMDFTKKLPKLVFVCAGEQQCSSEDAILMALLHFIGFDIAMFVPTGYQIAEQHFTAPFFEEYQIGTYMYDLQVPELRAVTKANNPSQRGFIDKLFNRR